jgi:scyllo-inositol 2-dehydrogenase (NADP+)
MSRTINTAIIGFGLAGRVFHSPILSSIEGYHLSKIYTKNPESIKSIERLYPHTKPVSDISDIMSDDAIQLVVIATPNREHFPLAKEALLAGKHVVVDKPFTITSEDADQLIALAKQQNRLLSVHQNRRWDSDFKTAKNVLDSGMLGKLAECEIHMDRYRAVAAKERAWREEPLPGSGMLYDLGSHLIDQALCLFGAPKSLTADLRMQRSIAKSIDNFELLLHYDNLKVTLKSGMLVRAKLPHFILLGEQGSFVKYGIDVQEEELKAGLTPLTKADWGAEPEELYGTICTTVNGVDIEGSVKSEKGDYREYYRDVLTSILEGKTPAVTAEQARNTIRIIEYAQESSQKGATVQVVL